MSTNNSAPRYGVLSEQEFAIKFQTFKSDAAIHSSRILIFIANDVDALCAQRMLTMALREEGLPHQVVAVSSYEQLKTCCEDQVKGQSDIRHIIMINCGASIDLRAEIFSNDMLSPFQSVYVIDYSRPVHLNNVFDWPSVGEYHPAPSNAQRSQIYLLAPSSDVSTLDHMRKINHSVWLNRSEEFRDEVLFQVSNQLIDGRSRGGLGGGDDDYDDDDDDYDDEDGEYGMNQDFGDMDDDELADFIVPDDEGDGASRKKREDDDDDYMDYDDYDDDEMGDADFDEEDKLPPVKLRVRNRDAYSKSEYEDLMTIMRHYTVTSYGVPSSVVMYEYLSATSARQLLSENNKSSHNNALWSLIIGFTNQYVSKKLTLKQYNDLVDKYVTVVMANNNHFRSSVQTTSGNVAETTSEVRITYRSDDYVFALYRHWNLYSAMLNSPHLHVAYNDWKTDVEKVSMFLAKIGVPLIDCKQPYTTMRHDMKETFNAGVKSNGSLLTREPLLQRTFVRFYGTDFEASAFDMVHILRCLMTNPVTPTQRIESIVDPNVWGVNWHIADDALNGDIKVLQQGVRAAIATQRKIVQQVKYIISSQLLRQDDLTVSVNIGKSLSLDTGFYIAADGSVSDNGTGAPSDTAYIFVLTPTGIQQLAELLMSVLERLQSYRKPLIIFAPSGPHKQIMFALNNNRQNKSPFAYAFRRAALSVGVPIVPIGFQQAMVELNAVDKVNMMSGLLNEFILLNRGNSGAQ